MGIENHVYQTFSYNIYIFNINILFSLWIHNKKWQIKIITFEKKFLKKINTKPHIKSSKHIALSWHQSSTFPKQIPILRTFHTLSWTPLDRQRHSAVHQTLTGRRTGCYPPARVNADHHTPAILKRIYLHTSQVIIPLYPHVPVRDRGFYFRAKSWRKNRDFPEEATPETSLSKWPKIVCGSFAHKSFFFQRSGSSSNKGISIRQIYS